MRLKISFQKDFEEVKELLTSYMKEVVSIFSLYKQQGVTFTADDFRKEIKHAIPEAMDKFDISKLLLDLFVTDVASNIAYMSERYDKYKFIQEKRDKGLGGTTYRVMNGNYNTIVNHFLYLLSQTVPHDGNMYHAYIPISKDGEQPKILKLLSVLELFGLASYEIYGGKCITEQSATWFSTNALVSGMAKKQQEEFMTAIDNGKRVYIYFVIGISGGGTNKIEFRAEVMDLKSVKGGIRTPDDSMTPELWINEKSTIWIKISNLHKCNVKKVEGFQFISNGKNLSEALHSNCCFGYITEI